MTLTEAQLAFDFEAEENHEGCDHSWILHGRAKDGTAFYRCNKCGIVEEG